MAQAERWMARYNKVKDFIERERRNSSKYYDKEKLMVHFSETRQKTDECRRVERASFGIV